MRRNKAAEPFILASDHTIASVFCLSDDPASQACFCHPDDPSIARGWKDLGQLRVSEAGTGFEIAQRSAAHQRAAQQTDAAPRLVGSNSSSTGASGILRRSGSRMTQGKDESVFCLPDDPASQAVPSS
jgi:hypothetical protein